jgi:hypothetical protein
VVFEKRTVCVGYPTSMVEIGRRAQARQHYAAAIALTESANPVRSQTAQARAFGRKLALRGLREGLGQSS